MRTLNDKTNNMLSKDIKARRKAKGLTQQELADRSGLTKVYIGQIERGMANPTIKAIHSISKALGCDIKIEWVELT